MTSSAGQARADRQAESRQDTTRTVLIAGGANIVVMIAKLAAGILTGSSAMLAEAAHSFADTLNQVFLFTSVRQGQRPADDDHPFGYGQERYFWSLLAAFGIFIAGAGFSIFEGILSLNTKTQRLPHRVRGAGRLRHRRGHLVHPGLRAAPRRGPPQSHGHAGARQDQPGHHGQGGAVRGHRGGHRAGPRRVRPADAAGHRVPGVGRRGLDRDRGAADRGGLPPGHGQPGTADRPGGRPQGDQTSSATRSRRRPAWTGCSSCRPCTSARTA